MTSTTNPVGAGSTATGPDGPSTSVQQLGAAPGSAAALLGYEGNDLGNNTDLTEDHVEHPRNYIQKADVDAREATDAGYVTTRETAKVLLEGESYVANGSDREFAGTGVGAGLGREEAVNGSNPAYPGIAPPAILAQTPGHIGSIPAERVNRDARLIRDMGTSRQPAGHLCSNPAERECEALDDEIARLESAVKALRQQSVTKLIRDIVM